MTMKSAQFQPFDETSYLDSNPDVRNVHGGRRGSGWQHFLDHGYSEHRPGVSLETQQAVSRVMTAQAARPPDSLMTRVHGTAEPRSFAAVGKRVALDLFMAMTPYLDPSNGIELLDFGCGCGRVAQFLRILYPSATINGTDIDRDAVQWCTDSRIDGVFYRNEHLPPLDFPDGKFDFVFAVSVFTHLPEDMQKIWLGELRRVAKSDGYLALTYVNEGYLQYQKGRGRQEDLEKTGFVFLDQQQTPGMPLFYQTALHTQEYIRRVWSEFFTIIKVIPEGINQHQDLVICMPR